MKKIFIYLIMILSLTACGGNSTEDGKIVSFGKYYLTIPNNFILVENKENIKDFKVLFSYVDKTSYQDSLSSSLIIFKYLGDYPKDEKEFFSIVSDKFRRQIPGSKIVSISKSVKDGRKIYYFTYEVYDNLFDDKKEKANYYGLQAYIFDKKNIYLISYVSSKDNRLKIMIDSIKNLHINK